MYCTYITIYKGDLLPRYYIGSSSVKRVKSGYHGSVRSKKYRATWESELKTRPGLFYTRILQRFDSRVDALKAELALQIKYDVVKSDRFSNGSLARKDGFFGHSKSGIKISETHRQKIMQNHAYAGKLRPDHAEKLKGIRRPEHSEQMSGSGNPMFGKQHPNKGKTIKQPRMTCEVCGVESTRSAIIRYHKNCSPIN